MKKLMALLLAVGMTASIAGAQEVLSRNAVGYVKVDVEGAQGAANLYLVSMPFRSLDGAPFSLIDVFGDVPNGSTLSLWDPADQTYIGYAKSARGAWSAEALAETIDTGDAVFVRIPADEDPMFITLMGEVPDEDLDITRGPGLTMTSIPFPAAVGLLDTVMADELPNGATIALWDEDLQTYVGYAKSARGAWPADAGDVTLQPGQAFFIRSDAPMQVWTETKPYTWP